MIFSLFFNILKIQRKQQNSPFVFGVSVYDKITRFCENLTSFQKSSGTVLFGTVPL
jgi:hypothetical protein